jgi:mono/diheme cytochrome c family protein
VSKRTQKEGRSMLFCVAFGGTAIASWEGMRSINSALESFLRKVDAIMRFTITRLMSLAVAAVGLALFTTLLLTPVQVRATADDPFDAAGTYKAKCVACHGAAAEKRFDKTQADDQLVDIVMKGKKAEKPPNMPAYSEKGITAEQAKSLVDYMKSIKQ